MINDCVNYDSLRFTWSFAMTTLAWLTGLTFTHFSSVWNTQWSAMFVMDLSFSSFSPERRSMQDENRREKKRRKCFSYSGHCLRWERSRGQALYLLISGTCVHVLVENILPGAYALCTCTNKQMGVTAQLPSNTLFQLTVRQNVWGLCFATLQWILMYVCVM